MNFLRKLFKKSTDNQVQPVKEAVNIDELLNAENQNDSIIALDDYICSLCTNGDDISHLSQPQRNFHYIQELEREVNNGGFYQYFFNSAGDYTNDTIPALNAISAFKTALILQKAIDQFPDQSVPKHRATRQHILDQIETEASAIWEELTQEFFKYEDDLNDLNIKYIKVNRADF
ncbi:DMP19 family protein [Pedobacter steynii]